MSSQQRATANEDNAHFKSTTITNDDIKSILIVTAIVVIVIIGVCIFMCWRFCRVYQRRGGNNNHKNGGPSYDQVRNPKDHFNWNVDDVVSWASTINNGEFKQYAMIFKKHAIDGKCLCSITKSNLYSFGIHDNEDRMELFQEIQNLNLSNLLPEIIEIE